MKGGLAEKRNELYQVKNSFFSHLLFLVKHPPPPPPPNYQKMVIFYLRTKKISKLLFYFILYYLFIFWGGGGGGRACALRALTYLEKLNYFGGGYRIGKLIHTSGAIKQKEKLFKFLILSSSIYSMPSLQLIKMPIKIIWD